MLWKFQVERDWIFFFFFLLIFFLICMDLCSTNVKDIADPLLLSSKQRHVWYQMSVGIFKIFCAWSSKLRLK